MSAEQQSLYTNESPLTSDLCGTAESDAVFQISQGLCPFATNAVDHCVSHLCGPNPPCQAFWTLPDVEDSGNIPWFAIPAGDSSQTPSEPSLPPLTKKWRHESEPTTSSRPSGRGTRDFRQNCDLVFKELPPPKHRKKPKYQKKADQKQAHSQVERRYREHLNAKFFELLSALAEETPQPATDQLKKAEVLQAAIDYINQSQLEIRHMTNEIKILTARIRVLEAEVAREDLSPLKGWEA